MAFGISITDAYRSVRSLIESAGLIAIMFYESISTGWGVLSVQKPQNTAAIPQGSINNVHLFVSSPAYGGAIGVRSVSSHSIVSILSVCSVPVIAIVTQ